MFANEFIACGEVEDNLSSSLNHSRTRRIGSPDVFAYLHTELHAIFWFKDTEGEVITAEPPRLIELFITGKISLTNGLNDFAFVDDQGGIEDWFISVRSSGSTNNDNLPVILRMFTNICNALLGSFNETFLEEQDTHYKYAKQSGGKGQYAEIRMIMTPNPGKGYEFINTVKGGHIPGEFIPSVDKGIQKTLEKGVLAGFPVVDVKINLYDGSFHPVDSSDFAFQTCASICFKEAFMKAHPVLLEPVMKLEVITPDEYMGDIIGNLNKRRGRIEQQGPHPHRKGLTEIKGFVPLAGMFGYANDLRNISSGRASFSMEFAQYEQLNAATQEEVLKKLAAKRAAEEAGK